MPDATTLMTTPPAATTPPSSEPPAEPPKSDPPAEPPKSDPPAEPPKSDPPADPPKKAPEAYEFKAPEGKAFDEKVIGTFSEAARKLDLSQEDAQSLIDSIAPVMAERQSEIMQEVVAGWADQAKSDKEFGGEKLDANLAIAKKAFDAFSTPELKTLLNDTGLGNHPEVLRAFWKVGKAMSEDSIVTGNPPKGEPKSTAQRMYPDMNP